ncbi:hypothetical protein CL176_06450 [Suicoccus acidiformans]|uniref:Tyrosine specific protein phosphatases domain-containing protein n=1 Tax=Suicoccus acidiformans TaxID=2036206 RepID=A0A347WKR0_9LACT|nr:hypothetical protein CL176_06450 [Suicoccus acidiformans]
MIQYFVRLPLDGVNNCRDLGGYAAGTTNKTQWGRFLRSSRLTDLTEESATVLKNYGEELKLIIDLSSKEKMKDYPVSEFLEDVVCINIDLLDIGEGYISSASRFAGAESDPTFMSRLYIEMLEHTQGMRKIFLEMLQIEKGTVLFNCSQGKDRTGVVAFLLLGLAGVNKEDIVANYEISFTHIQESYD